MALLAAENKSGMAASIAIAGSSVKPGSDELKEKIAKPADVMSVSSMKK